MSKSIKQQLGEIKERRVYAVCTQGEFYDFADRAKAEGLNISDALTGLIQLYGSGGVIVTPKMVREHAESNGVDYLKEKV